MQTRRKIATETAVLAVVPCLLILAGIALRAMTGPFEADPDYAYLLNGLSLLTFHAPGHYDHPGTTLQIIAALVIVPAWLISAPLHGMTGVKNAVLSNPQYFLHVINLVLIAADAAAAFYMGRRIRAAANLGAALAAQISVLGSYSVMIGLNRVTPEPLLLACGLLLAGYLAPAALQPERFVQTRAYATRLGALLGFIIVTKITAIPLLATVFFLRGRHFRLAAAKAGAIAMLVLTFPIAVHYPQMMKWFARLFVYSGAYGGGHIGVPGASNIWDNFLLLFDQTPEIFVIFVFYVLSFPLWRDTTRRVVAICALILGVSILMVLKEPVVRHFMPIVGSIALANAAILSQWSARPPARIGGGILALLLALGIGRNAFAASAWAQDAWHAQADNQALLAKATTAGCQLAFYYEVNTQTYNLGFGDEYTSKRFAADLDRLYPNTLFYDVFGHRFQTFTGPISSKDLNSRLAAGRCIYLVGSLPERFSDFGIPQRELALVMRTDHGQGGSIVAYAWRPQ